MGQGEQDDWRGRVRPVFSAGKAESPRVFDSLWMISLVLTVVVFLLYKSVLWWAPFGPSPGVATVLPSTAQADDGHAQRPAEPPPSTNRSAAPGTQRGESSSQSVTQCVLNGQVSFTDRACPGGASVRQITVHTAMVGTVAPSTSVTTTPVHPPQVVAPSGPAPQVNQAALRSTECHYLDEQIKHIDALARQPQTAPTQDELSRRRLQLRSGQFALRC